MNKDKFQNRVYICTRGKHLQTVESSSTYCVDYLQVLMSYVLLKMLHFLYADWKFDPWHLNFLKCTDLTTDAMQKGEILLQKHASMLNFRTALQSKRKFVRLKQER